MAELTAAQTAEFRALRMQADSLYDKGLLPRDTYRQIVADLVLNEEALRRRKSVTEIVIEHGQMRNDSAWQN